MSAAVQCARRGYLNIERKLLRDTGVKLSKCLILFELQLD